MSEPVAEFVECSFCEFQCKYRGIAEKNMKADEEYTKKFFDLFREGDLDAVANHIANETIKIMETKNPDSLLALGVCLYTIGVNILEIPEVLRRRLGRLAKSKLRTAIKENLGIPIPVAKPAEAAVRAPAAKAPVAKAPAAKVPPMAPAAKAAVRVPAAIEMPEAVEEETEAEALPVAPVRSAAEALVLNPAGVVENWLRSDKDYLYYIDEITQKGDDLVEVKYDLETEGFIASLLIKVLYSARDESGNRIIKIAAKAPIDVPYHLNVIMGKTEKGVVATSLPGDLKDEDALYKRLQQVEQKEGTTQTDRLTLMLNRDKFLSKIVSKSLILESPNENKVRSVKVPITIQKRGDQGCDLVVKTFLDERLIKPSDIFINIMDGIAENMDYLLELPKEERGAVPMAKGDWFSIKVKPEMGAFSSKFIKRVALPDIPTCPHCNRPLPQSSSTDYRRCPFCYEKL